MDKRPLILIVEDDDPVAAMIEDFLQTGPTPFRIARARDGREAVTRARELWPDLIVMDLMMPRLTGGEAANELRRDPLTNRIPIIAISAVADVTSIAEMLPLDAVLPKPFDLDDLAETIDRLLAASATAGMLYPDPALGGEQVA